MGYDKSATSKGFTEQFVDYADGRENPPTLTVMVGISGSGKSVLAKQWVNQSRGDVVRFNRDNLRAMLYVDVPWSNRNEDLTRKYEQEGVKLALRMGRSVIVDDTNCVIRTRHGWEEVARDSRAIFRLVVMSTPLELCIERDAQRQGKECVGEEIVRRQYKDLCGGSLTPRSYGLVSMNRALADRAALRSGEFPLRLPDAPVVLVDMDGTLCNHIDVRSPYDESKVLLDAPWLAVVEKVRSLYATHNILIVSGRNDKCGEDSEEWLNSYSVPHDYLLMRDVPSVPDVIIKKAILDELLAVMPKDKIALVIDDRPKVVKMWMREGLKVYAVYQGEEVKNFTTGHRDGCNYESRSGYRRCPDCGAMENF
jgi:predicted kinase